MLCISLPIAPPKNRRGIYLNYFEGYLTCKIAEEVKAIAFFILRFV
jgi:hypothetical protein